ncbi:MAG: hypothetical protein JXQ93_02340 [Flavobacteriaceae bacterium]
MLTNFLFLFQNYGYNRGRYKQPWYEEWYETALNAPITSTIVIILILIWVLKKQKKDYHSNWNTLLDNFSYSTEEFYELLKKELGSHGIKTMEMTNKSLCEDGMCLTKRRYLRVSWKDYQYYICAAPFGNGFFISWHLIYNDPGIKVFISKIPFIGRWLAGKLFHVTFYKRDTASMFMTYTQQSVLKVIDDITKNKGVRALSEDQKRPILNDVLYR